MVNTIGGVRYKNLIDIPIDDISLLGGEQQVISLNPYLQFFGLQSGAIVFLQANISYDGGSGVESMGGSAYYSINVVYQNGNSFIAKNLSKLGLTSGNALLVTDEIGSMLSAPVFRIDAIDAALTNIVFNADAALGTTFESIVAYTVKMQAPGVYMGMTSPMPQQVPMG